MMNNQRNVQKLDVQQLDIRSVLAKGFHRLTVRRRWFKVNFWTGAFSAEETVTTVEPFNDRH